MVDAIGDNPLAAQDVGVKVSAICSAVAILPVDVRGKPAIECLSGR